MNSPKCPYCGGEMEYHWENNPMLPEGWFYCLNCHSQAPAAKSRKEAYAAAMKRENGWISVEDQLPEKDGEYLVWILYDFAEYPQYGIVHFDIGAGAFGEFVERFEAGTLGYMGDEFLEQKGILAWMPLPDPPSGADMRKEENDEQVRCND